MKSVFISYSSKNNTEVGEITEMFDKYGISYWKAPDMIPAGSNYAREIPKVIKESQVFLLVISRESQNSVWVEKEIDYAVNNKKAIVPVNVDECELGDMFRFYLNNVQAIGYSSGREDAFRMLRQRIFDLLGSGKSGSTNKDKTHKEVLPVYGVSQRSRIINIYNPQPEKCVYCGGKLEFIQNGIYRCIDCGGENYDYFKRVKKYLDEAGPKSKYEILRATGVPLESIDYFLREEKLEISKNCSIRLRCEKCGALIRTGYLCDNCKR